MIKILKVTLIFFAASIAGFSQAPVPAPMPAPVATTATTMPVARTLTSADGRTIDVTILSKSASALKAARADGKEFEIALDKLSEADKTFVAGLVEAPAPAVKKPTLLFIGNKGWGTTNETVIERLKTAGFDLRIETSIDAKTPEGAGTAIWPGIDNMTHDEIKAYDVIWEEQGPRRRLLTLFPTYQGVMVMKTEGDDRLVDFLGSRTGSNYVTKPHVKVDGNLIRYNTQSKIWRRSEGTYDKSPIQPEFINQAIAAVQKILRDKSKTEPNITEKIGSKSKRVLYVMEHALIYDRRIMEELEKDGHDLTVAWDNETKPLPCIIRHGNRPTSVFPVPTARQFIRPDDAKAKGFDAVCIGTTAILKDNREKMVWSQRYIDIMQEAEGLGLLVLVNSIDDYSKKQILSGIPRKTGKTDPPEFLKMDGNFIIYNRQSPDNLEESPEDPSAHGTNLIDNERRTTFNNYLKN